MSLSIQKNEILLVGKCNHTTSMDNSTIEKHIQSLNLGNYEDHIFLRQLTREVFYAKVWDPLPEETTSTDSAFLMYFIRNATEFVGAVVDMGKRDLHWFVSPKHRKQGYLTTAMTEVILPHLFESRDTQSVTFDGADTTEHKNNSMNVARAMGFNYKDDGYKISKLDVKPFSEVELFNGLKPNEKRLAEMKIRLNRAKNYLYAVEDEVFMATGVELNTSDIASKVTDKILKLEDTYWDLFDE